MIGAPRLYFLASLCGALFSIGGCGDSSREHVDGGAIPDASGDAAESQDILERLLAIDGMVTVEERSTNQSGYRFFVLVYEQPSNHDAPEVQTFGQFITLLHRDFDAPTVLTTTGYSNYMWDWLCEPAWLLGANQIVVEHRFFAFSRPAPANWDHLRISQAAADHHRIVEALRPIYEGPWLSTGISKGGMTSVYHRRFYPDDVDATIAYVAPISFGAPDNRYMPFFDTVGPEACRQNLKSFQRDLLENRRAYIEEAARSDALIEDWTFSVLGGIEQAAEAAVIELEWSFWQYLHVGYCNAIPTTGATNAEAYTFMNDVIGVGDFSDGELMRYMPYYFQTEVELGYPEYSQPPQLADVLLYPDITLDALYPDGYDRTFDSDAMVDIADWVATEGSELMFIYGENDPWTAGQFELGDATDSYKFLVPQGNHGAAILDLPEPDRGSAIAAIEDWMGVTIGGSKSAAKRRALAPPREPPRLHLRAR